MLFQALADHLTELINISVSEGPVSSVPQGDENFKVNITFNTNFH